MCDHEWSRPFFSLSLSYPCFDDMKVHCLVTLQLVTQSINISALPLALWLSYFSSPRHAEFKVARNEYEDVPFRCVCPLLTYGFPRGSSTRFAKIGVLTASIIAMAKHFFSVAVIGGGLSVSRRTWDPVSGSECVASGRTHLVSAQIHLTRDQ